MQTHDQPWQQDDYETIAGPVLHPADTQLRGRSVHLNGGCLARHRGNGTYVMIMTGGSVRSVDQRWARGVHEKQEGGEP